MLRLLFFTFFFLTCQVFVSASNIDELKKRLATSNGLEKVEILRKLSWELKFSEQKTALKYTKQGLKLAQNLESEIDEAELLKNLGVIYTIQGKKNLAVDACFKAKALFRRLDNARGIANVTNVLGMIKFNSGDFPGALEEYNSAIALFTALQDSNRIMTVNTNIANILYMQGNFEEVIPVYQELLDYSERISDSEDIILHNSNLGMAYVNLGNYSKALDKLYLAADMSKQFNDTIHLLKAENQIGLILRRLNLIDEALKTYEDALLLAKAIENPSLIATLSNNIGLCYQEQKQYALALKNFKNALKIKNGLGQKNISHVLSNIAVVYQKTEDFDKTFEILNRATVVSDSIGIEKDIALIKANWGYYYFSQNEFQKAEQHLLDSWEIRKTTQELKELGELTETLASLYTKTGDIGKQNQFDQLSADYKNKLYSSEQLLGVTTKIIEEKHRSYLDNITRLKSENERLVKDKGSLSENLKKTMFFTGILILFGLLNFVIVKIRKKRLASKLEADLEGVKLENSALQSTIEDQNRQMTLITLNMVEKQEALNSLKKNLAAIANDNPSNIKMRQSLNALKIRDVKNKDWILFSELFNKTFPNFLERAKNRYPQITKKDIQHAMLIKLHTSPTDAAGILGISTESVHTARYRLRKKLELQRNQGLEDLIQAI